MAESQGSSEEIDVIEAELMQVRAELDEIKKQMTEDSEYQRLYQEYSKAALDDQTAPYALGNNSIAKAAKKRYLEYFHKHYPSYDYLVKTERELSEKLES